MIEALKHLDTKKILVRINVFEHQDNEFLGSYPMKSPQEDEDSTLYSTKLSSISFFRETPSLQNKLYLTLPNPNYLYTDEDLNAIFLALINNYDNELITVTLLAATFIRNGVTLNRLIDALNDFFKHYPLKDISSELYGILPIAISEHWVGITMRTENGATIEANYYDSSPNYSVFKENYHKVVTSLKEFKNFPIVYKSRSQFEQVDSTSCSVILIETIIQDIFKPNNPNRPKSKFK